MSAAELQTISESPIGSLKDSDQFSIKVEVFSFQPLAKKRNPFIIVFALQFSYRKMRH